MAIIPSFRTLLRQVLHLRESPRRTALAFAIGIWIAFCPFYGFHTILVGLCTLTFGLNFLALFAGASVNNPWTIVPILGATYWTGAVLLGRSEAPAFDWQDVSFSGIYQQIMPHAVPFAVGAFVLSFLGALLSYPLAFYFISKYRQANPVEPVEPLPPHDRVG
jgi:uncharacterized protein (DUF2062 family)